MALMGQEIEVLDSAGRGVDQGCGATVEIGLAAWDDTAALLTVQERAGGPAVQVYLDRSALVALLVDTAAALARVDHRI